MGRHSLPDNYDDDAPAVLSDPRAPASRPRPGRHSDGERPAADDPHGLDVIETVMADDPDAEQDDVEADAGEEVDGNTAQIEPIVDPVLDEPLPVAVTTQIPPVVDGDTPPPRPSPQLAPRPTTAVPTTPPADGSAAAPVDAPADPSDDAPAPAAASDDAKADKAAAKAERAAAKAEAKAAKAEAKNAAKGTAKPARPEPRVSDLTLLRTDSAARARVIAAIVVPFLLYFGVLFVLDALDLRTALIWIWVPLISAGVVAGLLLDLAHRAAAARAIAALDESSETTVPS